MLGIIAIPAFIMLIFVFLLPMSPRWLMLKNKEDDAKEVLSKMRSDSDAVSQELLEIKTSLNIKKSSALKLLNKKFFLKVLVVGLIL